MRLIDLSTMLRSASVFLLRVRSMTHRCRRGYRGGDIVVALVQTLAGADGWTILPSCSRTGRWRRYHGERAFLENIQEAKMAVEDLARNLATREASSR